MIYINKELLSNTELSEVDIDFNEHFGVDYNVIETDYIETIDSGGNEESDGELIAIDVMINHLQQLKNAGGNYVSMEAHCDHNGYVFSNYEITKSTPDQIKEYVNDLQGQAERFVTSEIENLQYKIDELKKKQ